jgi:hypothetical protein
VKVTEASGLQAVLISILGRMISVEEMRDALGLATTTYYEQAREGRLITVENIFHVSRSLGINEVLLLVECGLLDPATVDDYVAHYRQRPATRKRKRTPLPDAPDL